MPRLNEFQMCGYKDSLLVSAGLTNLFGARVLRHCLSTFADSMLRQLARKEESHRRLDFARRDGSPLVLVSKSRCFTSDPFEDVVDERVHDAHRATGYTNIGMDLLQNLVDETTIAFLPRSLPLHHLCSSLSSFASLFRALLSGTLLRTLHRRWLSTGTHIAYVYRLNNLFTVLDENSKWSRALNCTPIYTVGLDPNQKTFDCSRPIKLRHCIVLYQRSIWKCISIRFSIPFKNGAISAFEELCL